MRLIIISDTHGSLSAWKRVETFVKEADDAIHLGDVLYHGPRNPIPEGYNPGELANVLRETPLTFVRGNCDADVDLMVLGRDDMPRRVLKSMGNLRVFCLHGDADLEKAVELSIAEGWHVIAYGHTHIPEIRLLERGIYLFNPGSLSLPKGGHPPSFGEIEIDEDEFVLKIRNLHDLSVMFEERSKL
ncbi:MAG: uncharacterized protein PWP37_520 [Thermotogota bacterium]|nr:uncharacterized protein [Thermotogota bacterium]MDK2864328.1 uncharacterized protein [Thermotogota bacterium]HCZ06338.1 phosphodiesterase [Thermotogota bacterium]